MSTEKYRLIEKEKEPTPEDQVRIRSKGRVGAYITYGVKMLMDGKDTITVKGTGQSLPKVVQVAEIIKRRVKNLSSITKLGSTEFEDSYEPLEEGLEAVTNKKTVTFLEITLSTKDMDTKALGYAPPVPQDEVEELSIEEMEKRGARSEDSKPRKRKPAKGKGKGKGKDAKGKGKGKGEKKGEKEEKPAKGRGRGGGKGSGKGAKEEVKTRGRGRGRGGA